MRLRVLSIVESEVMEAAIWYDDRRPGLGDEFLDDLATAYDRIRLEGDRFPIGLRGSRRHEVRSCMLGRFPYVVFFACRDDEFLVVAVSHVRRRPFYWLSRIERRDP